MCQKILALFAKSVDFHKNTLCLWALDNFPAKYDCMGNQAPLLHRINTFRKKSQNVFQKIES